jgi:hypothetical protein
MYCEHGMNGKGESRGGACANVSLHAGGGTLTSSVNMGPPLEMRPATDGVKGKYLLHRDGKAVGSLVHDGEWITLQLDGQSHLLTNHVAGVME